MKLERQSPSRLRLVRFVLAFAVSITSVVIGAEPSSAVNGGIADAQARADAAASAYDASQARIATLQDRSTELRQRVVAINDQKSSVEVQARKAIVDRYVRTRTTTAFSEDLTQSVRNGVMQEIVSDGANQALARYTALSGDLVQIENELHTSEKVEQTELLDLARARTRLETELERLQKLEADRIAAELKKRQAEEAVRQRQAAAEAAARRDPVQPTEQKSSSEPSSVTPVSNTPIATGDWICPVQGATSFSDTYGAPRPGGRKHRGVDMSAARGTPLVAPVSGVVTFAEESLGGKTFWLAGDDGKTYYGAHLDTFGNSGRVVGGTVIGTVGDTGDAVGYHLHFQIGSGGGVWQNPYPTVSQYC